MNKSKGYKLINILTGGEVSDTAKYESMKTIYRTYEDTEIVQLATNVECPYCRREWQEYDKDDCGKTYLLHCDGCGKDFKMHFDAS